MREHLRSALTAADRDQIIYDLNGIEEQYDHLLAELPGVRVRFAMKACPVDEVLTVLADRGGGFDAASVGEIRQALRTSVTPDDVHYGNTIKADSDIAAAFELGITTYATDSIEDVQAIARNAPGARVFCRLATDGEGAIWGLTAKCGTDEPLAVLDQARRLGLVPAGLSLHVGSQQMTVRAWEVAVDGLVAVVAELSGAGIHLDHINFGGGLPAAGYRDLDPPTAGIFAAIRDGMKRLEGLSFVVEPGRHLVADHGVIRASVARLTTRRAPWLYLTCGKFNGLYEADQLGYPLSFPNASVFGRRVPAVIAGPSCDSDDTFGGAPVSVPASLGSGDPVWIHSAGAYATSYTTVGFNGFDPLPVLTVRAERIRPVAAGDWSAIAQLEAAAHGAHGLAEGPSILRSRAGAATSFVLDTEAGIGGYVLALPYPDFHFPDLSHPETTVFESSNLHLHDLVVGDSFRGMGWAKRMLRHLTATAESLGYSRISLVAVAGMDGFWSARDFEPHPDVALPEAYGKEAVYMSRDIG
jgi:ornithine decarboxylase